MNTNVSVQDLQKIAIGMQHKRLLTLSSPQGDAPYDILLANRLEGEEFLSRDFRLDIEIRGTTEETCRPERIALFKSIEMTKRIYRIWLAAFGFCLAAVFSPVAIAAMGGVDHLADNLSVTDFWVNGAAGSRAGQGGASMPSPALPDKWHRGLTVHVVWDVRDWEHDTSSTHEADVPVDPYTEDGGDLRVHFLADGTVRVVVSNVGPRAQSYPGPHDPIPRKRPWEMYPPRGEWRDWNEQVLDDRIIKQRCITDSDPRGCESKAEQKLRDDERSDARRYLPRCAPMTGENHQACQSQALQSMRASRFARRCAAGFALPDCAEKKAVQDNAAQTKRTPIQ